MLFSIISQWPYSSRGFLGLEPWKSPIWHDCHIRPNFHQHPRRERDVSLGSRIPNVGVGEGSDRGRDPRHLKLTKRYKGYWVVVVEA
ncbi:hypothetical protein M422DRAFT_30089 [Sphaerobolus stellatus SS14]|uniref:Uncharacterized protein n=1 Tax=Sphaerobolus stellatus (strain SS14) TaxID=990650 RepID=A0A0C9VDV1_SPHS4|nr:hypothetical protein M422DRAFT_30089 [Sphaerobolus stellatus SS14]